MKLLARGWTLLRVRRLHSRVVAAAFLAALVLLPGGALASAAQPAGKTGVVPGASLAFTYEIYTTFETPNGNTTSIQNNNFTVHIVSVNQSAPYGEVGYTISVGLYNNTAVTNSTLLAPSAENFTTVFDPYENLTYLGNIGFWPWTYPSLASGSVTNVGVNTIVTNVTEGNVTGEVVSTQYFNATTARGDGNIYVNLTQSAFQGAKLTDYVTRFNSTTGVLEYFQEKNNLIGTVEKIFTYRLVFYDLPTSYAIIWYFAGAVVVVAVAVLAIYSYVHRPTRREKAAARIRARIGG